MSPEVKKLSDHLTALRVFIASPAHEGFVTARTDEIKAVRERICTILPDSQLNVALLNQAHGELDCLEEIISTFEDAALVLKARIDEKVERENQSGTTTKV